MKRLTRLALDREDVERIQEILNARSPDCVDPTRRRRQSSRWPLVAMLAVMAAILALGLAGGI